MSEVVHEKLNAQRVSGLAIRRDAGGPVQFGHIANIQARAVRPASMEGHGAARL